MKLSRKFYNQPTLEVAKKLLGKFLIRKIGKKKIIGMITETEAYVGPHDLASHASKGKTPRTKIMFGEAGRWYVYLIYGMYYCLNVVTEKKDYPAAVLIRAIMSVSEQRGCLRPSHLRKQDLEVLFNRSRINFINGPGKVCQYFKIDKRLNGQSAFSDELYIENRNYRVPKSKIISTKRIGVDYAGKYKDKRWRFYIKDNEFVTKK